MMGRGGMMGGMRGGGDSTSAAIMTVVHELMTNHDKLRRTVTNLPNGIRTLTESDDPVMAQQIKKHVSATGEFVTKGVDPNLPMSSPALHGVLRNGTKITRQTELTAKGVLVIETSTDSATVALLQAHAAEVTDLVNRGMAAMHEKMMGGGAPPPEPTPTPAVATPEPAMAHAHTPGMSHDSAMASMHASSDASPNRQRQRGPVRRRSPPSPRLRGFSTPTRARIGRRWISKPFGNICWTWTMSRCARWSAAPTSTVVRRSMCRGPGACAMQSAGWQRRTVR